MEQSDFRTLLHRYQQGKCTPTEKQRIEQWYKRLGSEQAFDLTAAEKSALMNVVWQRIKDQTNTSRLPARALAGFKARAGAVAWPAVSVRWAAVALLALGTAVVGTRLQRGRVAWATVWPLEKAAVTGTTEWLVYANASAYEAQVALPDGSAVTLSPASTLKYPRTFRGGQRPVYLTGGAFFDVFHDANHPFLVYTDRVVTTVLGTRFWVKAYTGQADVQVQVRAGKVRVSPRPDAAGSAPAGLDVLPNQQAVYSAARRQLRRELVAEPVLLAPRRFVFADRPVAEVLAALETAYGIPIKYDAAALHACTLTLSLGNEPLFAKLDVVCEALGATYEQADGRIIFHSPPCQVE